mmetsp:Transcript_18866/g.48220  ORF Transcript_18866/g.48220 Transcript_18866/m.48220 type:complete len:390 (+) Transcript_18866:395-1564(+)
MSASHGTVLTLRTPIPAYSRSGRQRGSPEMSGTSSHVWSTSNSRVWRISPASPRTRRLTVAVSQPYSSLYQNSTRAPSGSLISGCDGPLSCAARRSPRGMSIPPPPSSADGSPTGMSMGEKAVVPPSMDWRALGPTAAPVAPPAEAAELSKSNRPSPSPRPPPRPSREVSAASSAIAGFKYVKRISNRRIADVVAIASTAAVWGMATRSHAPSDSTSHRSVASWYSPPMTASSCDSRRALGAFSASSAACAAPPPASILALSSTSLRTAAITSPSKRAHAAAAVSPLSPSFALTGAISEGALSRSTFTVPRGYGKVPVTLMTSKRNLACIAARAISSPNESKAALAPGARLGANSTSKGDTATPILPARASDSSGLPIPTASPSPAKQQ